MRPVPAFTTAAFLVFSAPAIAADGAFAGLSGHVVKGPVSFTRADGKITVTLDAGFSLDNAPDAYVALGKDTKPLAGGVLAKLKSKTGAQSYSTAASVPLEGATQVLIWCKQYAVPLGVADIR